MEDKQKEVNQKLGKLSTDLMDVKEDLDKLKTEIEHLRAENFQIKLREKAIKEIIGNEL
tara:strand:+ start:1071 stop:1247 length:177 start_codon:yes stop_codon:yes gene_type:complete